MKRFILFLMLAAFAIPVVAQQKVEATKSEAVKIKPNGRHEIAVNYGYATLNQFTGAMIIIGSLGLANRDTNFTGDLGLSYLYYPISQIGVGAAVNYEYGYGERERNNGEIENSEHHYITLLPTAKFYWFDTGSIGMYSRLGVGVTYAAGTYNEAPDNRWSLAFQASAISIDMGNQTIRGFVELGFGTQGILVGGLSVRF